MKGYEGMGLYLSAYRAFAWGGTYFKRKQWGGEMHNKNKLLEQFKAIQKEIIALGSYFAARKKNMRSC